MSGPTIRLLDLLDPSRLHPDDWVWITPEERDALVEAVGAAQRLVSADTRLLLAEMETPNERDWLREAQAKYERAMYSLAAALARFTEEGT